jgi:protein tyrosine/serine phosphatase
MILKTLGMGLSFFMAATSVMALTTKPATSLKNFHAIDSKSIIFRGAQPVGRSAELKKLKITDVLIIKQQTRGEVDQEVQELTDAGIRSQVIPMKWADVEPKAVCLQMIEAVETLVALKKKGRKTYLHCTAGEDRTGSVSALFRMVDQQWSKAKAFESEMCGKGYADGNPKKPFNVVRSIEGSLTPAFFALANSIESGGGLNPSVCNRIKATERVVTCRSVLK